MSISSKRLRVAPATRKSDALEVSVASNERTKSAVEGNESKAEKQNLNRISMDMYVTGARRKRTNTSDAHIKAERFLSASQSSSTSFSEAVGIRPDSKQAERNEPAPT